MHDAFSLVELVLVMAIIAVFAGIALPRYGRSTDRYYAAAMAQRVMADLQQAQERARATSASCSVTFTVSSGIYTVTSPSLGNSTSVNLTLPPFGGALQSASFGGSPTIVFNGYGIPSSAGSVVVKRGQQQRTVSIAATGAITIAS